MCVILKGGRILKCPRPHTHIPLQTPTSPWDVTSTPLPSPPQALDGSGGWGNTADVSVDAAGWVRSLRPNQQAGSILIRDLQGHIPAGTYTVVWEGEGTLDFGFDIAQVGRAVGWVHERAGGMIGTGPSCREMTL